MSSSSTSGYTAARRDSDAPNEPKKTSSEGEGFVPTPNRWELFIVQWPRCACCFFFLVSIMLTMVVMMMFRSGRLEYSVDAVFDVRSDEIVMQRDAFLQGLMDGGLKIVCGDGGPQQLCEAEDVPRTFTTRSLTMDSLVIIYEAKDDSNLLSEEYMQLIRNFESNVLAMSQFKSHCQLGFPHDNTNGDGRCGATTSLVNDAFADASAHQKLMTTDCFTAEPICASSGALCIKNGSSAASCLSCGAGGTAFGTPPCRSSVQAQWTSQFQTLDVLCDDFLLADTSTLSSEQRKARGYFVEQKSKLLPQNFACNGRSLGKVRYLRSFMAFGAPLPGHSKFSGDEKDDQGKTFSKWFAQSMWNDLLKMKQDVEESTDGALMIYPIARGSMLDIFFGIFAMDGMLALCAMMFVLCWLWTATGSFFLALCGIYESFISLILSMLQYSLVSKYVGFLNVMVVFIIIGIGADDVFVFLDAFKQSAYEKQLNGDLKLRFAWAYRRSRNAMFVTTATTFVSFLGAGFSEIPSISAFGFFAALTVAWNYILVMTFFAAATTIYHRYFEQKLGGHMCIQSRFCCCRLFAPSSEKKRSLGWRAFKRLLVLVSILVVLGSAFCMFGYFKKRTMVSMLGTILICVAAIFAQAILNMPDDPTKMRTLEVWFSQTFHGFLVRHSKKIVCMWLAIFVLSVSLVAIFFRPAEEAPKFLREDHTIMKFIDLSSEFTEESTENTVHVVFGIDKNDAIDRSGVDRQAPIGDYQGKVKYSATASEVARSPAGQSSILKFCDAFRASDLVLKHPSCKTAFHASTNPTFQLPTLGNVVGHCSTGVYCFMYNVRDFLTAHCRPCARGVNGVLTEVPSGSFGCNPSLNFTSCKDSTGTLLNPTFPAPDLHKVLQSSDFQLYMASLPEKRYAAGHGHDNAYYQALTGFKYNPDGWVGFLGANYSMPIRSSHQTKEDWYDKTARFVQAESDTALLGFATCERYGWMVTESALQKNTLMSVGLAMLFAWAMLVVTGWNWCIGTLGLAAVVNIVTTSTALMVVMGWKLGPIEAIAIITVAGVSVDYSVHLIHAYAHSEASLPSERVRAALASMGISLIGGVATTFGAALFLWFAEIQFFSLFGQFLALTVSVSLIVALTFLMPLAMLIGPSGNFGQLCNTPCCKTDKTARTDPRKAQVARSVPQQPGGLELGEDDQPGVVGKKSAPTETKGAISEHVTF